jgi:hypothetical protein
MERKIAGLLGAAAALGTLSGVQAAPAPDPSQTLRVSSFAELLQPIPNATALLQAIDEQAPAKSADANVQVAQFYHHHHHHHHHHGYYRGYDRGYGSPVVVVPRYRRYHHHHHHHHHSFYRRDY